MKIANITTEWLNGFMTLCKYLSHFKNQLSQYIKAYYAYHSRNSKDKIKCYVLVYVKQTPYDVGLMEGSILITYCYH